ncbi:MAG TPA: class E sortase [Acidimicrobiales bacterium]|nr:class E sortase [Acidimicrobiales bacterium]
MRKDRRLVAAVSLAVVLLAAAGACSTGAPRPITSGEGLSPLPTVLLPPVEQIAPDTTALPRPVRIPDDPYAPEPVTEIGSIEIPRIGLVHPLFSGVTLHNVDRGPSHWPGSAMPGQRGNAVVAGHRATHSRPFSRIHELRAGDLVVFSVAGARSTYRVTDSLVVRPADTWIADQTEATTATLYACHPPGSETHRYVVRLELAT